MGGRHLPLHHLRGPRLRACGAGRPGTIAFWAPPAPRHAVTGLQIPRPRPSPTWASAGGDMPLEVGAEREPGACIGIKLGKRGLSPSPDHTLSSIPRTLPTLLLLLPALSARAGRRSPRPRWPGVRAPGGGRAGDRAPLGAWSLQPPRAPGAGRRA